ncbi:MAG TPA: hypothetical protein VHF25_17055 [Nitriliruptorales bacterium]|nr:hypothetical protein [Nitriliruptorales bacterium]
MVSWDRRSPAERDRIRDTVLRGWMTAAADFSPFWSERLTRAGVSAAEIRSPEDLQRVPPVRELELLDAGGPGSPALLLRPREEQIKARASLVTLMRIARGIRREGDGGKATVLLGEYKPIHLHASGRDRRLAIAYTRSDLDRLHRAGARAAAVLDLSRGDHLVSAIPADGTLRFWGLYHLALGASILAVHARRVGHGLEEVAVGFRLAPATVVAVPVSEAIRLAATLADAHVRLSGVHTVVVAGPPPDVEARRAMVEAWQAAGATRGVRVLAVWAPVGARALWAECAAAAPNTTGLHTYPDLELLEVVDPVSGRPVDHGPGDLTYTSAGWHGTGLIRFRTGDRVGGLTDEPCPACGRTVPRVLPDVVPAAWQPLARTADGPRRLDLRGAALVLSSEPGVGPWRVELRGPTARRAGDAYVVQLAGELAPAHLRALDRRLAAGVGLAPLQLIVSDHEQVEATADGVFADRR